MDTKYLLKKIKEPLLEKYPDELSTDWVCDEDKLVHQIISLWSIDECLYYLTCSHEAIEILIGKNPLISENLDIELDFKGNILIPSWGHLLDVAGNENWNQLQDDILNHSSSMFICGYMLICLLIFAKINLLLGKHKHSLYLLCIRFSDFLEQDKYELIAVSPKKALERITKFIDNIYKKPPSKSLYDMDEKYLNEANYQLFKAIVEAIPSELSEAINKAIYGEAEIDFIPRKVSNKIKTKFSRDNLKDMLTYSLDKSITDSSKETFKDILEDDFDSNELINIIENQELMNVLTNFITDNPDYLTDYQKQALSLVLEQGKSFKETGKEMEITKQTAHEHFIAAIKKLSKVLTLNQ